MCPKYEQAMALLGKRWTPLILRALMDRPRRFSEIRGYVDGLSDRLLAERLRELVRTGVAERRVVGPGSVVEYALTDKGAELRTVVLAVQSWADRWVDVDQGEASRS